MTEGEPGNKTEEKSTLDLFLDFSQARQTAVTVVVATLDLYIMSYLHGAVRYVALIVRIYIVDTQLNSLIFN